MSKKLTRSYDDRWLAGVLSGFAKYFNTKPLYLRIAYILQLPGLFPGLLFTLFYWQLSRPIQHIPELPVSLRRLPI